MADWMIYGATGYTGTLVAEEAVRRGHKPLLAGRSEGKLKPLADRLKLDYVAVSLDDTPALQKAVTAVAAVYHAAGPFIHTAAPMLRACLAGATHYLDITGEIPVYQLAFSFDSAAREQGVAILPGVGFDVIPSDCLLKYVADQLPDATHLEVVVDALNTASGAGTNTSAGTTKSMLEILPRVGNVVRREGNLMNIRFGEGARWFQFPYGRRYAMPAPWGDVEMGYHTTGIPNITAYLTFPPSLVRQFRLVGPLLRLALQAGALRDLAGQLVDRQMTGPSEARRSSGRSWVYARVHNTRGEMRQAWLETVEAYRFTAEAGVRVVERVLDGSYRGALTPARAFGADFVLEIPGTRRHDTMPTQ
ncbi:MAG: saccharopine dehydrogenase NADP-binding domain-containing protein [Chloroflexi bacterium]|nr:saccharopine dehydrogenase NADP-binding domain-containing protein [Chloroflexota bacterium]